MLEFLKSPLTEVIMTQSAPSSSTKHATSKSSMDPPGNHSSDDKSDFSKDKEFIRALQSQNHSAFKQLVARYHTMLLSVARSIIGTDVAEEVVQEAWLSAFNALPKFEGRSSLKTWLYTIASNHAKSRLRKESRIVCFDPDAAGPDPIEQLQFKSDGHWANPVSAWHIDTPDGLLEQSQLQKCIDKTLSLLPEQQKAVFMLRDIEQVTLTEICNILELSDSNTRVLLHRARVKLMQVIDRYQETGTC